MGRESFTEAQVEAMNDHGWKIKVNYPEFDFSCK
jgi:hypothetical protein